MEVLGIEVYGVREEFDAGVLPNGYEEIDEMLERYQKKFLSGPYVNNTYFDSFESILRSELGSLILINKKFLNNNFQEDTQDFERLGMIINKLSDYGSEKIDEIMYDLENPEQEVGLFKSLIAKLLN